MIVFEDGLCLILNDNLHIFFFSQNAAESIFFHAIYFCFVKQRQTTLAFPVYVTSQTPIHGEVYSIQHVIKFVSDLRRVSHFLRVLRFPPPIKLTCRDIAEILLKVALNAITLTLHVCFDYH